MRHKARQPFQAKLPQPVIKSMQNNGVQTGIRGQHFQYISRRRVTVEYTANIFSKANGVAPGVCSGLRVLAMYV
jgi:hypothetical protein